MEDKSDFRPRSFKVVPIDRVGCIVAAFLAKGVSEVTLYDVFPELLKPVLDPGSIIMPFHYPPLIAGVRSCRHR
jgi:2-dehydropantoate 2-reductase